MIILFIPALLIDPSLTLCAYLAVLAARRVTDEVPAPTEPYDLDAVYAIQHNGAKAKEILGATYRSMEDTCRDIVSDYEARGLL